MQFTIAVTSLLAAAGLSAAAPLDTRQDTTPCPVVQEGDYIWKIDDFYARKPDGKKVNSVSFNIKATNNGTLDFTCGASADTIEDDKFYSCGENSFMWFAFQQDRSGLILQQSVSDEYVALFYISQITFADVLVVSSMLRLRRFPTTAARVVTDRMTLSARVFRQHILRSCSILSLVSPSRA